MKKYAIGFILGAILFSGIGVAAYTLLSSDVSFSPENSKWQVGNVEDALNSLYISKTSDNYSNTEKVVGTWTDGKPIYQITIEGLNVKMDWVGTHAYTSCSIPKPVQNVKMIIDARAYMSGNSNGYINWSQIANINMNSETSANWTIASLEDYYLRGLTIRYTKTTD